MSNAGLPTNTKYLRVSAGPGTGKTTNLCRDLVALLQDGTVSPNRVLVMSFTRTSAADLRAEPTDPRHAIPRADEIHVSTLHAECFRVLSRAHQLEALGRVPRPLMDFERTFLHADLSRGRFRDMRTCEKLINEFEAEWATSQSDDPCLPSDAARLGFLSELNGWLTFHRCMLIGEVIPETRRLLAHEPEVPVLSAYDHVLVDEYQDLNRSDQEVIFHLVRAIPARLTVIGDENQSIYAFRHAHPEGLTHFPGSHQGEVDTRSYEECHRCPKQVVDLANQLISRNTQRASHVLRYGKQSVGVVEHYLGNSLVAEMEGIAAWVANAITTSEVDVEPIKPKDCLVLVPRRTIGAMIAGILKLRGIPARTVFREDMLSGEESQRRMTLLALCADPTDRVAFRCWLGLGRPDHGKPHYERVRLLAGTAAPREYLLSLDRQAARAARVEPMWRKTAELEDELIRLNGLSHVALIETLFPVESLSLMELRTLADEIVETDSPAELLKELRERIIKNDPGSDALDAVRVMTYHASKGLSARVVVLASCIEGLMPQHADITLDAESRLRHLEEQRRLFYVGLTRAKERLLISGFRRTYSGLDFRSLYVYDFDGLVSQNRIRGSSFVQQMNAPAPNYYPASI